MYALKIDWEREKKPIPNLTASKLHILQSDIKKWKNNPHILSIGTLCYQ